MRSQYYVFFGNVKIRRSFSLSDHWVKFFMNTQTDTQTDQRLLCVVTGVGLVCHFLAVCVASRERDLWNDLEKRERERPADDTLPPFHASSSSVGKTRMPFLFNIKKRVCSPFLSDHTFKATLLIHTTQFIYYDISPSPSLHLLPKVQLPLIRSMCLWVFLSHCQWVARHILRTPSERTNFGRWARSKERPVDRV